VFTTRILSILFTASFPRTSAALHLSLEVRILSRLSLQTKVLLIQIGIVVLVAGLIVGTVVSVVARLLERQSEELVLGIAQTVAVMPTVKAAFNTDQPQTAIQPLAEQVRQAAGLSFVVVANKDLIRYSHTNPDLVGKSLRDPPLPDGAIPEDDARALSGETFVVVEDGSLGRSIRAKVPIHAESNQIIGEVSVGVPAQRVQDLLASYLPELAGVGILGLLVGTAASFLLARHIKGQILGLEPAEIAGLFEQREALLHGVREGLVAVDRNGAITVVNDEARRLLNIPEGVEGWPVGEVIPQTGLPRVLRTGTAESDRATQLSGRNIVVSRIPVRLRGRLVGAIATFRDQTELQNLARELQGTRTYADTLRAQAHEFANKLHTIAGLLELGWTDQAVAYITRTTREQQELTHELPGRIADPTLVALLIGKASVASERGIAFSISPTSHLAPTGSHYADSLSTIVGNLVENAFDAVEGQSRREIVLDFQDGDGEIRLEVRDSGPGVASDVATRIFESGFSTKPHIDGRRGIGLALVKQLVTRQGGEVSVRNENGAVFVVRLPRSDSHSDSPGRVVQSRT
jgi:two-component system CitB family sensor kinase